MNCIYNITALVLTIVILTPDGFSNYTSTGTNITITNQTPKWQSNLFRSSIQSTQIYVTPDKFHRGAYHDNTTAVSVSLAKANAYLNRASK